jgi:AsmA protein
MTLKAEADTAANPPGVSLLVHAPGLPLSPLLATFSEPAVASGNLEVYADLHGTGDSPHAIAASLSGPLGIALANGTIDNRLLGASLGKILQQINLLDLAGRGGTSDVRCLAARLQFQHGDGALQSFALSSSLLTMTGGGSVNLGNETLALLVKPQARIGGTGVTIPMRVTGPIRSPATKIDSIGTAEDNAGTVAGAIIGNATPLGLLGGMLGVDKLIGAGGGDVCAGPLALARGNAPPAETAQPASKPKPAGGGLLQQLFR